MFNIKLLSHNFKKDLKLVFLVSATALLLYGVYFSLFGYSEPSGLMLAILILAVGYFLLGGIMLLVFTISN